MVGKAVKEADDHQQQGIRHHNDLIAQPVNDPAHQRRRRKAADCGYSKEKADGRGARFIKEDQNIGAKGEKYLLPRPIKHLQHIVFPVFFVEIEPALGWVCLTVSRHAEGEQKAAAHNGSGSPIYSAEQAQRALSKGKNSRYDQITGQRANLMDRILQAQRRTAPSWLGVLQRQRVPHPQLEVLSQGIDTDGRS